MSQVCEVHTMKEPCPACEAVSDAVAAGEEAWGDAHQAAAEFLAGDAADNPMDVDAAGVDADAAAAPRRGGVKQPRGYDIDMDEWDEEEEPDLITYFDNFPEVNTRQRIAICRTYANYLSAAARTTTVRGSYTKRSKKSLLGKFEESE